MAKVWDIFAPQLKKLFSKGFTTKHGRVPPLRNPDDVADAVSRTFELALDPRARLAYDGRRPFLTWLATIGRNAHVTDHRKHGRELPSSGSDDYDDADLVLGDGPDEPDKSPVAPEAHAVLQTFFANQPERIRILATARHLDDLTDEQIAAQLGLSRIRVRELEARMLEQLRGVLERAGVRSSADRLTPSPGESHHG
jgi:RNA polymerase sigma-70 factor (ECF subfamily)